MNRLSQDLETLNGRTSLEVASGALRGPGLDEKLVHREQTAVQEHLDAFNHDHPTEFAGLIASINRQLNPTPGSLFGRLANAFPSDRAYQGVLNRVRHDLGRDIDFKNQADREKVGNALIHDIKASGGCQITGSRIGGC